VKKLLALCVAAGLLAILTGCPNPSSSSTSKTNTKETSGKDSGTGTGKTVTPATKGMITIEPATADVAPDKDAPLTIKVKRGDYKDEIMLAFTIDDKSKVSIKEKDVKIAKDASEAKVTVVAAKDAPEGEVKVEIKATGKDMEDAKGTATVKVKK
jgi:hypothetical protein